jgi:hypothetical protein
MIRVGQIGGTGRHANAEAGVVAGEVGVLHSSDETAVMGVERRQDTCSGVRRDVDRWLRKEIRRHDGTIINPDFGSRPEGANRTGLGEPMRENRPFGSMRSEVSIRD